jgi:hypothetical protein
LRGAAVMYCRGVCGLDGILEGVGGGLITDWLTVVGGRYWLTAGETVGKRKGFVGIVCYWLGSRCDAWWVRQTQRTYSVAGP